MHPDRPTDAVAWLLHSLQSVCDHDAHRPVALQ
ncbi:Uncharacterised protein [Vibrio cholerae]|nr:Uncharacterised protein [Vibrio cholerae]